MFSALSLIQSMERVACVLPQPALVERFTRRLLRPLARLLRTGNPAATLDRLFTSRHVMDLQLIVAVSFLLVLVMIVVGVPMSFENQLYSQSASETPPLLHVGFSAVAGFLGFFAPVLGVFGLVLAWAYQVGSARLGVVDLFACEVSTLCRVAAVVDTVRHFVEGFDRAPSKSAGSHGPGQSFTSQEDYFPVFSGNVKDLQALEARVVINITAFYTYMKAVRDSRRALAQIAQPDSGFTTAASEAWQEAARTVVYMLFLGLESARRAIADLVEFEPEQAERTIVVLLNELEAYRFLRQQYPEEHEMHHERIMLREPEYRKIVPKLCDEVEAGRACALTDDSPWLPAWLLLPALRERYETALTAVPPIAIPQHAGRR